MEELYYSVELPLCRVLADMETAGFLVDRDALADFGAALQKTTDRVEQAIYDAAGETFNINSPKQLGYILFEKLQLPHGKRRRPAGPPTPMCWKRCVTPIPSWTTYCASASTPS